MSSTTKPHFPTAYKPIISPEHGVYVVLLVSFLVGVALGQQWTWESTLALICAFLGFQAEHPLVLQIKQRKSWQPRFLFWGGVYGGIAGGIALYFALTATETLLPLLAVYLGAGCALLVDAVAVFRRGQKSILNEMVTFAAVCLVVPFAYIVTTNSFTPTAIGLWGLCTLYFSGTIFTVKLRKIRKGDSLGNALKRLGIYCIVALAIIILLYWTNLLPLIPAFAFSVLLLKVFFILIRLSWYRTAPIRQIASLETTSALTFGIITLVSLLPVTL
ncbi:MAG: hypothetical protein GVY04_17745 [Cyanobacteria bacterium]|jgi:hypothetical protein|nr:hypothetical protein [Cyanobacteria bacterium GSL.Bin1]